MAENVPSVIPFPEKPVARNCRSVDFANIGYAVRCFDDLTRPAVPAVPGLADGKFSFRRASKRS